MSNVRSVLDKSTNTKSIQTETNGKLSLKLFFYEKPYIDLCHFLTQHIR